MNFLLYGNKNNIFILLWSCCFWFEIWNWMFWKSQYLFPACKWSI